MKDICCHFLDYFFEVLLHAFVLLGRTFDIFHTLTLSKFDDFLFWYSLLKIAFASY